MSIEPYVYRNGEVHGADPEVDPWDDPTKTPGPAQRPGRQTARGRGTSTFARRAQAAKRRYEIDPQWAERSAETRRLLLDLDLKEEL